MKTTVFSFNRIGLLFQRYFIERFNTELIYWGIMVIVFMFIRNVAPLMIGLILIAGVFYAARFFREIHSPANGIAYFMIPATQLEKLTVAIVMTSFYYFAMMIITYVIGNLLGTFINNMLASVNFIFNIFHHSPLQWNLFETGFTFQFMRIGNTGYEALFFVFFLFSQSVYLLGSVYFKSNQFFKTFLSTIIVQLFLFIIFIIETRLIMITGSGELIKNPPYDFGTMMGTVLRYVFYLLPPFFWVVSYFRLTEKQV